MCLGGEKGPQGCQASADAVCRECSNRWTPADTNRPGRCPNCESYNAAIARCDRCPLDLLDHMRQRSAAGRLLERILQLDFIFPPGAALPWSSLTVAEVKGLQILRQERDNYQRERIERDQANGNFPN